MDIVSAPPNKKPAPAGSVGLDADPFPDPFDSQGSAGTPVEIRTLHEMREAGENRRITEEAEFLAQGLDASQPLTLRQYSALDLLRKLSKPAQRRKLASNNSLALLLGALSTDSDPIIVLCFLLTVHAILADPDIQHVAVESLAIDKHLFQSHLTATLSNTTPISAPIAADSKQARVILSDLHTLADSLSIPPDMLSARLLWITNVHKLALLAPATVACAMDTTQVSALIQSTLAHGLNVTDWTSGAYLEHIVGLLDQLSFESTAVAKAFSRESDGIVALAQFAERAHQVLACKVSGNKRQRECTVVSGIQMRQSWRRPC
ncbi:hypothetical protein BCR44DRAFT_1281277 [Catenaria anguillulae PL171]|uniref:Wings apart-like protein C-terminal domain-containing protein n=1 Tax=Catenaria anguillulae PL171 TaxID=765915 RepID=A0A1Y2HW63_9FUNG|nr:hypothetical protein BCR44DRAFT_1281277 [Catenaria anguillulae PL171]